MESTITISPLMLAGLLLNCLSNAACSVSYFIPHIIGPGHTKLVSQ